MATTPSPLKLTRDQLAKIVGVPEGKFASAADFEAIRQLEKLLGTVNVISITTIDTLQNIATDALSAAQAGEAQIVVLDGLVGALAKAPAAAPMLANDGDVRIDQVAARQTLVYDDVSRRWLNDALDLDDLGDVTLTIPPADGDILIYDAGTQMWVNGQIAAGANISVTVSAGVITIATVGASGSFTTVDGKTVTVSDGVITSIV